VVEQYPYVDFSMFNHVVVVIFILMTGPALHAGLLMVKDLQASVVDIYL
jgi:hypothetical protein